MNPNEIFKVDVIENSGENWMLADFGHDIDGKHYILTTNYVHASELHQVSKGPREDAQLVADLLNNYYTKTKEEDNSILTKDDWKNIYDFYRLIYLPFIHSILANADERRKINEPTN